MAPIASVAAAAALWLAPPARAAETAPDWLRAAAKENLPSYDKDTVAVILLDEKQTTVRDNGEIETRHRAAVRLLRPQAREEYGGIAVDFAKDTKISYLRAWTITAQGREIPVGEKDSVERGFFNEMIYEDVRVKALQFPEANPGNVVGFEYVQRHRPYVFEDHWSFQDEVPVKTARFVLQIPDGWTFTTSWFNYPEQKPQAVGSNQYVWEVKDLPAVDLETLMPPWRSVAGWAGVKYFPRDPALRIKTNGTWKDLGVWYSGLTQSSRIASAPIHQKVAELTSGISDPLQKIRVLTEFMQRSVRYFAVEIGIGGYQPHPAAEVFAHQYGDCKDKATLLSTMLHEIGVESYYLIVNTHRGAVHPDYASMGFNHMILAIRLPDDVKTAPLYAVVDDPQLGRLLLFDPTNEHVPLGYLPWYLQANYGLLVGPDGGKLLALPLLPPSTNRMLLTGKFDLDSTGSLSGEVQGIEWGGPAARERDIYLDSQPSKRSEILDRFLGAFLGRFTVTSASITNLEKDNDTLVFNYKFVSPGYASGSGDLLLVRPRVVGSRGIGFLRLFTEQKPRKYPIQFEDATRQDDMFDIAVPAGYVVESLPQPLQAETESANYRSETKFAEGVLHYRRSMEIKDVNVPTEKLQGFRVFLQQVVADQNSMVVLRRAAP